MRLFNHYGVTATAVVPPNWFAKIKKIDLQHEKLQLVISTIIDGTIVRGVQDKYKVCESFHNNLLIFVAFQDDLFRRRFEDALTTLRTFGIFYEWLADRDGVTLFPNANDRQWFEKNVIENATIALRKGDQILFRKPTEAFHPISKPINKHMGYSELLETYQPDRLKSFAEVAVSVAPKKFINMILKIVANCGDARRYPNIFTVDKIVNPDSWLPFTNELLSSNMLIFEDRGGKVQTFPNNAKNFIGCCLKAICAYEPNLFYQRLDGKYLANLSETSNIIEFLQHVSDQLNDITEEINNFYFDLAAAASIYLILIKLDPLNRIDKFVDQYHKINTKAADKHLYGVVNGREPKDANPIVMLETVRDSLQVIRIDTLHTLAIFLDKDIEQYIVSLGTTAEKVPSQNRTDYLKRFERANVKIYHTGSEMDINGKKYPFTVVWLLNSVNEELIAFEPQHSTLLNSSEHVYWLEVENQVHLLAIPHSVSKIYQSIIERYKAIKKVPQSSKSFPDKPVDTLSIKALTGFHSAAEVVAVHRDLTRNVAEQILINWLRYLPTELQHPFVELIRGHVCMAFAEIDEFKAMVKSIRTDSKLHPFLIKRPGDLSGTHRILQQDPELGRFLEQLSPFNLPQDSKNITIITDNLLSGTQITNALAYYATDGTIQSQDGYVLKNSEQTQRFREILKNIEVINICSVLYTTKGINKIKKLLQDDYGKDIEVKVVSGRDITKNAFFGTSVCIGEADKDAIRNVLKNGKTMARLRTLLDVNQTTRGFEFSSDEKIDNLNLVARYKSLPKRCFDFLHIGLRHDPTCHPFVRVR